MELVSSFPQEFCKEFLKDNAENALECVKKYGIVAANETIKKLPRDSEGNIYKKQFFLGNFCIRFRIF